MAIKKTGVKQIPLLVKIFSILNYFNAGILFFAWMIILPQIIEKLFLSSEEISLSHYILIILTGIAPLFFSALFVFVGIGLWTGKNWARITEITMLVIVNISIIIRIIKGDFFEIFGVIIISLSTWYLSFNPEVKKVFS